MYYPQLFPALAASGYGAASLDPYIGDVVLLVHGDGANGSTSIVDSSSAATPITVTGTTQLTTTSPKFGSACIQGSASGYWRAALGSTNGNMTGDFTLEMWVRQGTGGVMVMAEGAGYLYQRLFQSYGGPNLTVMPSGYDSSVFQHVAISRTGSTIRGFMGGVQQDAQTYSGTVNLQNLRFGQFVPNNNLFFTGQYDDVRITKGVGRYTANFTPPAAAFPNP